MGGAAVGLPFALAVKLPVIAADLLIVAVLATMAAAGRASPLAPWLYAVHPVSVLVGSVHGQFDAIPLLLVLVAVECLARGRRDASALALAGAIATKSFPVLLLPFLAAGRGARLRSALRYGVLALAPGALLLLPFAIADAPALGRELFGYSGIADFGWTALARGADWILRGAAAAQRGPLLAGGGGGIQAGVPRGVGRSLPRRAPRPRPARR